jgi:hypothetical protein
MDEAIDSMIVHLRQSSHYMSTNKVEFWNLSEDE